jgi:sugar phosphate isomerase/epimerase
MNRRRFITTTTLGAASLAMPGWLASVLGDTGSSCELGVLTSFEKHASLKQAGFQFIEDGVSRVLMPKADDAAFDKIRKAVETLSLPIRSCAGFIPAEMKIVGPDVNTDSLKRFVETAFVRAKTLGIVRIVLGSGKSRQIPEGFPRERAFEQLVGFGKLIAPIAQANGVIVVLEPLNKKESNFINRVEEGLTVVEAVNHPNFQQLADFYHMMCEAEGPASLLKAGRRLRHCHVATVNRNAPGAEETDFRPYFKALKEIRYQDGISIECRWKDFAEELPTANRVLREQFTAA